MLLTDARIRTAKPREKPYKLTDDRGLYLEVRPTGKKLWRYRYRIAGSENVFAMGEYPAIGLADARESRDAARKLVKQGIHPAHARQSIVSAQIEANENSFESVAKEWIGKRKATWSPYYLYQVERVLQMDVYPAIGRLPIRGVTAAHILKILHKVEGRGAETVALLIRQICSGVFRYAVATLRADGDPAAALKGVVKRPKIKHSKPLPSSEIPKLVEKLDQYGGFRTTAIAIRLLLLTFVRTVELRKAEWSEFDLDKAVWTIPDERMKMRETHIVPLSTQAVELLKELRGLTGNQRFLFPNYRRPKTHMTATTLNRALERLGYGGKFSAHGFRTTASTLLNEMGYRPDVIARQLAHRERNKVHASYNQAGYMADRKAMMQQWADYLDGLGKDDKVVPGRVKK
jgi:integrase